MEEEEEGCLLTWAVLDKGRQKGRGDPGGKARERRAYLVHVCIAAGGRVTGLYLGRGVGARDSMQDRAGLTLPLPPRRPSMTLCPSMDKAVKMEGVGGGERCPAAGPAVELPSVRN